jgi:hypothetical protein
MIYTENAIPIAISDLIKFISDFEIDDLPSPIFLILPLCTSSTSSEGKMMVTKINRGISSFKINRILNGYCILFSVEPISFLLKHLDIPAIPVQLLLHNIVVFY